MTKQLNRPSNMVVSNHTTTRREVNTHKICTTQLSALCTRRKLLFRIIFGSSIHLKHSSNLNYINKHRTLHTNKKMKIYMRTSNLSSFAK